MGRSNQWRRESFIPFNFLQNELARVLEDYFQPEGRGGGQSPPTDLEPSGWSPLIDVYETPEDTIVVRRSRAWIRRRSSSPSAATC